MQVIIILAVTTAFMAISRANDDKKDHIINFYSCISCHNNPEVIKTYKKCAEMMPAKIRTVKYASTVQLQISFRSKDNGIGVSQRLLSIQSKKITEECLKYILIDTDEEEEQIAAICKNKKEENEKMYFCVWHDIDKHNLTTEEEEAQLEEFIECAEVMNLKYCESEK